MAAIPGTTQEHWKKTGRRSQTVVPGSVHVRWISQEVQKSTFASISSYVVVH